MRILIGLHHLVLGGDTINALELADRLRKRGDDVSLFALVDDDGADVVPPLLEMAAQRSLPVWTFTRPRGAAERLRLVLSLARFARRQNFDVVHSFGHQDTYFLFVAMHGLAGVPLVVNDYAMTLTRGLPRRVPLVVGTRLVHDEGVRARPGATHLVEPPVDLEANRPGVSDRAQFRRRFDIADSEVLVVIVSRLVSSLKGEGLAGSIEAVRLLGDAPVRLVIVGEGGSYRQISDHAAQVNTELGREAVVLAGPMIDPRPAYAAADVVLGMGHSGLRAMAFGKALVVLGEGGFARPLTPDLLSHIAYHGVYGNGSGGPVAERIAESLGPLVADPDLRARRGQLGLRVVGRYGLDCAVDALQDIYRSACRSPRRWTTWAADATYMARTYAPAKARRAMTSVSVRQVRIRVPA
jgi:hypothetical protein